MSESWATIDPSESSDGAKDKIEIEIEQEEVTSNNEPAQQSIEVQPENNSLQDSQEEQEEEAPHKELEGIKTKGAEKRIKQLIRQRKERDEELESLRGELHKLKSTVNEKDSQLSSTLKTSLDSHENQLSTSIDSAKQLYKQAVESGDTDGMLGAQESLSKAYADMSQMDQRRQAWTAYNESVQNNNQQQQVQQQKRNPAANVPQHDPKAVEWATKNSWFGEDQIMTAAALTVDQELKSEGYDPSDDDFYIEVDDRLRQKYPHKFASGEEEETPRLQDTTNNSAQVVAGASRTPKTSSSGKNKVKLTQEDVRLANKWGIPLEKYAAEKLKVDQAEGEYTSIYN
tara:strand:- start:1917 stop:2945 length:1029 start_codon:yes stop_codon:yes gene_type:complete